MSGRHESASRYANGSNVSTFSIPEADFQRGNATLKRRPHLTPPPPVTPSRRSAPSSDTITMRARSKSKSRSRIMSRKTPGQEFVALGSNRVYGASTLNTNKAMYHRSLAPESYHPSRPSAATTTARSRSSAGHRVDAGSRSLAPERRSLRPILQHTRSKSVTRKKQDSVTALEKSRRERSKSAARHNGRAPSSSRSESMVSLPGSSYATGSRRESSKTRKRRKRNTKRSPSHSRHSRDRQSNDSSDNREESSRTSFHGGRHSSRSGSSLQEIEDDIADIEQEFESKKKELDELQEQLTSIQKRTETKELEVYDLQVDLDALRKRRERRLPSNRSPSSREEESSKRSRSFSQGRESRRSTSQRRPSKRPCIVDEDNEEDDDDDDVVIISPSEGRRMRENSATAAKRTVVPIDDSMPDNFWGRSPTPKLLVNHRFRAIPDGSIRKGRHLAFNSVQPQFFATSPDEGGLILWSYQRQDQDITKVVTLMPSSFRRESPCAEAISWSPDGNRMAMAFRDPLEEKGEFCIVQLHQLKLGDSHTPQPLPRNRITSKCTTLHPRGISSIGWLPSGFGSETTSHQLITTGNSDHAVVLWKEHEDRHNDGLDLKWSVLHRDHRSEVRSLCIHSKRNCLYTGGLDGLLIRYDLDKGCTETVMERRKPNISKINSILEHPHNPNLLLVSCVEHTRQNLLLHDLRQRYDGNEMTLSWEGGSMSQYVVPRWSPAGYHVSCGSKTGVVNIWDVRMRGDKYPTVAPQQSLRVHHKTVLHATWHPRYDAMFSVSHDRTLGLLTFR